MISCSIDATEGRDVATVDIPGVFLQTAMDDLVYVTLRGDVATQLEKTNPAKYRRFLKKNRHDKPYSITELRKALYGTHTASKLFYEDLTAFLVNLASAGRR